MLMESNNYWTTAIDTRHLVNDWNVMSSYIGVWNVASPFPSWHRLGGGVTIPRHDDNIFSCMQLVW